MIMEQQHLTFSNGRIAFADKSDRELHRAYRLFRMMKFSSLISLGAPVLKLALMLQLPVKKLIKSTVFSHFCGGENIDECMPVTEKLWSSGIRTILDYSVEGSLKETDFDDTLQEILRVIGKARNDRRIIAVFKPTGLGSIHLLENACKELQGTYTLTEDEKNQFERFRNRFGRICREAYEAGVTVYIDAEESWIQDVVDSLALELMMVYNRERPVIYNTVQMYRTGRLPVIREGLDLAVQNGFVYAVKLVRGAYMEKERARAEKEGYPSPIQPDKDATDREYDEALEILASAIAHAAICAGTHNEQSTMHLVKIMEKEGIPPGHPNILFSQLLGMSDCISYNLASSGYNVAKYVPYGPVIAVFPYLLRRAQENTSISGQMGRELQMIHDEMKRRKS
jgi:proline dehydrogenase